MSTAQDSPRRKKQKIRRAKQLAGWRAAKDTAGPAAKAETAVPRVGTAAPKTAGATPAARAK